VRPSDAKNQRPSRFYLFKIHQKMGEIIIKLGFSTKFYSPSSIRCTEYCQVTRRWSRTRIFSVSSASSFAYRCSTTVKGCSLSSLSRISSYRQRLLTFDNLGAWRSEVRAHAFSCEQRIVSVLAFCPVWIWKGHYHVSPFEACEFLRSPRDAALLIEYYGQQPSFLDWRTRNSKFKIDLDF